METLQQMIRDNILSMTTSDPYRQKKSYQQRLKKITHTLAQSETGAALLAWSTENDITIAFDPQIHPDINGLYSSGVVILSPEIPNASLVSILAHELRHAWQDQQGLIPNHCLMDIAPYRAATHMTEADAFTHQLQVCHELANKNINAPLEFMQNDADTTDFYGEAVTAYQNEINTADTTAGQAMDACFWGWMQSHARHEYDATCIDHYHATLDHIAESDDKDNLTLTDLPNDTIGLSRYFNEATAKIPCKPNDGLRINDDDLFHLSFRRMTDATQTQQCNLLIDGRHNLKQILNDVHPELEAQYKHIKKMYQALKKTLPHIKKASEKPVM